MHCSWREEQQQELEYPKQMPLQINPPQSGSVEMQYSSLPVGNCCAASSSTLMQCFLPHKEAHPLVDIGWFFCLFFFFGKALWCLGIKGSYIKCTVMTMCLLEEKQPSLRSKALCVQHYFFIQLVVFKLFSFQPPLASINS